MSRWEGYMRLSGYFRIVAVTALCLFPAAVFAQEFSAIKRNNNAPPKPSGPTPRTPEGHPDLTGEWNGLGDNLLRVPNQIANNATSIESESVQRDRQSETPITTSPSKAHRT